MKEYTPLKNEWNTVVFKKPIKYGFITVIIPVYKDSIGLRDTLTSLSQQTIEKDKYEIIVANDGGDRLVEKLSHEWNVRCINIIPNLGSYNARNRALEESTGEYIAFVDSDMTVVKDWLNNGIAELQQADYIGGPVTILTNNISEPAHYHEARTAFPFKHFMEAENFSGAGNLFVRRSVMELIGGFDRRLHSGGDKEFGKRIYKYGNIKQIYSEKILAYHPPRGYTKLVNQRLRIEKGNKHLSIYYPDYFKFSKPRLLSYLLVTLVPPNIRNVKKLYDNTLPFSFFKYYIFCWKYKVVVNLRKIPIYYFKN
jgi:glycosyltransferase AglI